MKTAFPEKKKIKSSFQGQKVAKTSLWPTVVCFYCNLSRPTRVYFIELQLRRPTEKPFQECRHCTKGWLLGIHVARGIRYSNQGGALWGHGESLLLCSQVLACKSQEHLQERFISN